MQVYDQGAFPYRDIGSVFGVDSQKRTFRFSTNSSPRAFLVHAAKHVPDYEQTLDLLEKGWDVRQVALVEQPVELTKGESTPGGSVSIRDFQPDVITLEVDAKQESLLVLAEAWYPGWKIEINGAVTDALPANGWMRAFVVPAGNYQARVFYRQNYLWTGGIISLVSLAALGWVLLRKRPEATPLAAAANS